MTPFDRDDIYRLATAIDDICDFVDESAGNLYSYGVDRDPATRTRAGRRDPARDDHARRGDAASRGLQGLAASQLIELRALEDEGDRLMHESIAELFRSGTDPLTVIRWKDIHEGLEEAVDACENAADVLEAILVKNR